MSYKATTERGNKNRILRQDDSGTYYKDIVFVPSGTLAMKDAQAATLRTSTHEDASNVREFYKTVLAMPRTVTKQVKKKEMKSQQQTKRERKKSTVSELITTSGPNRETSLLSESLPQSIISSKTSASPSDDSTDVSSSPHLQALSNELQRPESDPSSEDTEVIRRNWLIEKPAESTRVVAKGHILCESCQIEVRQDDLERHRRGIAHLMSEKSPIKPLDTLTLGHSNKGFRMLVNSGWDYEKGLGAQGQGTRHPIATRLKHDRLALGAVGTSKKLVTHTFQEIEESRTKPTVKSNRRVPLTLDDYRRKAEKERRDRINLMTYMKK
ncbi:G patch domain and ankyrin repeat-containing protein 1 [Lobosporangium transversale]|uniref:G-patch domain-containing protein n=1 Tax=Lobosporangium transversale TaxID=64571 RepID=A0A1Y2G9D7_9FUNG|nr:hypothetical protein BCR41DRAFT_362274 [Lobosporangium transversale]KAF9914313.1 G patch domain and ankyrin repeat-containing protein 1 [Lobosporangium transversale]ORZ04801.1 hypothetical protein BCR41DRAFT_362274 [Lobosporangium transversale]|eukprot:XP_021876738.1 hypothetical protein BCR41DRAFT_362274 [Lobosporangium transversale]